jgi:hypothetical protein
MPTILFLLLAMQQQADPSKASPRFVISRDTFLIDSRDTFLIDEPIPIVISELPAGMASSTSGGCLRGAAITAASIKWDFSGPRSVILMRHAAFLRLRKIHRLRSGRSRPK